MQQWRSCPICSKESNKSISKHLYRCKGCSIIFNSGYTKKLYDDNYFVSDYKKQYGKTYADDFDNIYRLSCSRLSKIFKHIKKNVKLDRLSLLDLGAALGFFLKCAQDHGILHVEGVEISGFAGDYSSSKFGIKMHKGSFENISYKRNFDLVTAWYFIEHCENPALIVQKIFELLPDGGIFAFSVPSIFGPMYIFKRSEWINEHPDDHLVDFSPYSVKKFLKNAGFKNISIKISSFHPERMLSRNSVFFSLFRFFYRGVSGFLKFSDTMEVYAVK